MTALRLHLGCGMNYRDGWVNCDLHPTKATDYIFDAQDKWPFEDNSAEQILAVHMLEHLEDPWAFFREAWRVLRPTGKLSLQLPYGGSDQGMSDLTHRRPWFPGSFCAFQPGYAEAIGNPQHDWPYPFSIDQCALRIHKDLLWLCRWPIRYVGLRALKYLWGGFAELIIQMTALKTPGQVAAFKEHGQANMTPCVYAAWMKDWDPTYEGPPALKYFAIGQAVNTAGG